MAFATCGVIVVLSLRKRALSPDKPRLSPFTLVGIAVVCIIVAVVFRPSETGHVATSDLQSSPGLNWQQLSGLFVSAGGIYITLWAYGIVAPSQRERVDPTVVQRLKWIGPLTLVLGLCEILFHLRS
jgi:drug/metabolite transporter (DMT)-like permease